MGEAKKPVNRYHIRWMIRRDMPEVGHIENSHSETKWKDEDFLKVLRQRNVIGMVAEVGETVVGFVIYELRKTSLEVLNLAIHPSYRRAKAGQAIVDKLKGKLSSHRRKEITCEVRESNLSAHLFLKNQGFSATQVIRNHIEDYDGPGDKVTNVEDAYCFCYRIADAVPTDEDEVEVCER